LKDWVEWDTGLSVPKYASRAARAGFWGGGIEMAATSHLFHANVHVYEADVSAATSQRRVRGSAWSKRGVDLREEEARLGGLRERWGGGRRGRGAQMAA
jgi:hypothetical protein